MAKHGSFAPDRPTIGVHHPSPCSTIACVAVSCATCMSQRAAGGPKRSPIFSHTAEFFDFDAPTRRAGTLHGRRYVSRHCLTRRRMSEAADALSAACRVQQHRNAEPLLFEGAWCPEALDTFLWFLVAAPHGELAHGHYQRRRARPVLLRLHSRCRPCFRMTTTRRSLSATGLQSTHLPATEQAGRVANRRVATTAPCRRECPSTRS